MTLIATIVGFVIPAFVFGDYKEKEGDEAT